jgi:hypothetical protein
MTPQSRVVASTADLWAFLAVHFTVKLQSADVNAEGDDEVPFRRKIHAYTSDFLARVEVTWSTGHPLEESDMHE